MDHEEFLRTLNSNIANESVDDAKFKFILSELRNEKLKFLSIVEALQELLTNENVTLREKGVSFLSKIITEVPTTLFNTAEINVIVGFFCNCLKEHHSFLPATLKTLLAMINMKQTSKSDIHKIMNTLFQNVSCSSQLWSDRVNIFNIINSVIFYHFEVIQDMGPEFLLGLISFIEGETDPKCLLLSFTFLSHLIKKLDLGHFSEELFELLSCYFPIDYSKTSEDDIPITRKDLVDGLNSCLTANESFCVQCLNLIVERSSSSFKTAKLDSYKLLEICCKNLETSKIKDLLTAFWKMIQKDVIPGNDEQLCDAGLSALTVIIQSISDHECLSVFLDDVITCATLLINKINDSVFQSVVRVLVAVSSAREEGTCAVLKFLGSVYKLLDMTSILEQKLILSSFLPILISCVKHQVGYKNRLEFEDQYKELINIYLNSGAHDVFDVRKLAFTGIVHIVPCLCGNLLERLQSLIVDNLKAKDDIIICEEFQLILRKLGESYPEELHSALFGNTELLVESPDPYLKKLLLALSYLAYLPQFTDVAVPVYLHYITNSSHHSLGLENLLHACRFSKTMASMNFYHVMEEKHGVFDRLLNWWKESVSDELKLLHVLCEILALSTRNQNLSKQQEIVDKLIENGMIDVNRNEKIIVMEAIVGSVLPEVKIPNILNLVSELTSWALSSTQYEVRLSSCRLLASLINKADEAFASDVLKYVLDVIAKELKESVMSPRKCNCGFLFTWVIKSVVIRGKPFYEENIQKWFELLSREDVGGVIADNFRTVLEEDDLYLNWDSHCHVRVLYRQHLLEYFPTLLEMFKASEESVQSNYLMALCQMLHGLPMHLIQSNISGATIVLVRCLNSDKRDILLTALDILVKLLETKENVLGDYVSALVPKLLSLSESDISMNVRIQSLKCIFFYGFYPTHLLVPLKKMVIHGLESCLDDNKRLVRKEAVRARCRWFLVAAPGEEVLNSK